MKRRRDSDRENEGQLLITAADNGDLSRVQILVENGAEMSFSGVSGLEVLSQPFLSEVLAQLLFDSPNRKVSLITTVTLESDRNTTIDKLITGINQINTGLRNNYNNKTFKIIRTNHKSNMSGFGKWYEEQQAAENGGSSGGSSWLMNMEEGIPLNFESIDLQANLQGFSLENMKQTMEAQMPKKILGMGYQQRFKVFCALLFLSALFFALAFFVGVPMMAVKPQKFALSFTCGSLMFMGSFGILKGPMEHLKSMCAADRMLFTTIYLGSMFATLYLTFTKGGAQGYVLVMSASAVQLLALLWYLISFLPGGTAGLAIVSKIICTMLQPILKACVVFQAKAMALCVRYCCRRS